MGQTNPPVRNYPPSLNLAQVQQAGEEVTEF
jgi:hypothetical protein